MRKALFVVATLALVTSVAIATVFGIGAVAQQGRAERELHTFLHIGCKHHNHGPKWHVDHARSLGLKPRAEP